MDSMFGELKGYGTVRGRAHVSALGGIVEVRIDVGRDGSPNEAQRAAFVRAANSIRAEDLDPIFDILFKHYLDVGGIYREGLAPDDVARRVPYVSDVREFRRLLSNPRAHLPGQPSTGRRLIMFDWESTWEPDGVRAIFLDEHFVRHQTLASGWDDIA